MGDRGVYYGSWDKAAAAELAAAELEAEAEKEVSDRRECRLTVSSCVVMTIDYFGTSKCNCFARIPTVLVFSQSLNLSSGAAAATSHLARTRRCKHQMTPARRRVGLDASKPVCEQQAAEVARRAALREAKQQWARQIASAPAATAAATQPIQSPDIPQCRRGGAMQSCRPKPGAPPGASTVCRLDVKPRRTAASGRLRLRHGQKPKRGS